MYKHSCQRVAGAQARHVRRNQRGASATISIVLLSGGTRAKTAENPIMESACNYEAVVSYVLPRASQRVGRSSGARVHARMYVRVHVR